MPYPIFNEQHWRRQVSTAPPATPPPGTTAPPTPPVTTPDPTTPTSAPPTTTTPPTSNTTPTTADPPTSNTSPTSNGTSRPDTTTPPNPTNTANTSTPVTPGGVTTTPITPATVLSTATSQSVYTTVVTVTDGNGNLVASSSVASSAVPYVTQVSAPKSSSKSNTGAIVGGVVGGIAGLGLLILLLWCLKRKNKEIKLDENIFDPDRNVQRPGRLHGDVDLADAEARPYSIAAQGNNNSRPSSIRGPPEMQQVPMGAYHHGAAPGQVHYGQGPYANVRPTSQYGHMSPGHSDGTSYPTSDGRSSVLSPGSAAGLMSNSGAGHSYAASSTDRSVTTNSQNPRSAKEREQAAARRGMQLANTEDDGGSAVVQHRDGGRADEPPRQVVEPPREVPPAYDSIPHSPEPSGSSGLAMGSRATGDVKQPMS